MMRIGYLMVVVIFFISCGGDSEDVIDINENYPIVKEVYRDGEIYYKYSYNPVGQVSRIDYYQTGFRNQYGVYTYDDKSLAYTLHHYIEDTLRYLTFVTPIKDQVQIHTRITHEAGIPSDTTVTERVYFEDVDCGIRQEWSVVDGIACLWRESEITSSCNTERFRLPCQMGQSPKYLTNIYEYNDRKNAYGSFFGLGLGHRTKFFAFYSSGDTNTRRSYTAAIEYGMNDYPLKELRTYVDGKVEELEFYY